MAQYDKSTLNTQTGVGQPVSCIIDSNNDPLRLGRVRCRPATLSKQAVPDNNALPWIFIGSPNSQGSGIGETVHHDKLPGMTIMASMSADGTWTSHSTVASETGGYAPEGAATKPPGMNTYPPVTPDQIT